MTHLPFPAWCRLREQRRIRQQLAAGLALMIGLVLLALAACAAWGTR